MRTLIAAALAGALLILALSAAGPVASAAADNWNRRWDILRFPAPVNFKRCKIRQIGLNGSYTWLIYAQYSPNVDLNHVVRTRMLPLHGRYRWWDCLRSYRPYPGIYRYYMHSSGVRNERTGGEAVFRQEVSSSYYDLEGRYEWGSRLIHQPAR